MQCTVDVACRQDSNPISTAIPLLWVQQSNKTSNLMWDAPMLFSPKTELGHVQLTGYPFVLFTSGYRTRSRLAAGARNLNIFT